MLLSGLLSNMDYIQISALLSCLITFSPIKKTLPIVSEMRQCHEQFKQILLKLNTVLTQSKVEYNPYTLDVYHCSYINYIYYWMKGQKFSDLCEMQSKIVFEGTIIKVIQKVDDILSQLLLNTIEMLNDDRLKEQLEKAKDIIHRGLPFINSLYF